MEENKLKSVIDKLKKDSSSSKEEQPTEQPKEVPQETKVEEPKAEPNQEPTQEEIQKLIQKRIADLQNVGIANLEVLGQLSEINKTLTLLTVSIMKALGIEEDEK